MKEGLQVNKTSGLEKSKFDPIWDLPLERQIYCFCMQNFAQRRVSSVNLDGAAALPDEETQSTQLTQSSQATQVSQANTQSVELNSNEDDVQDLFNECTPRRNANATTTNAARSMNATATNVHSKRSNTCAAASGCVSTYTYTYTYTYTKRQHREKPAKAWEESAR